MDFHHYAHAVAHWNLPPNPVTLEQREGRVHRYKSHAVRKNVAAAFGTRPQLLDGPDPWCAAFDLAAPTAAMWRRGGSTPARPASNDSYRCCR